MFRLVAFNRRIVLHSCRRWASTAEDNLLKTPPTIQAANSILETAIKEQKDKTPENPYLKKYQGKIKNATQKPTSSSSSSSSVAEADMNPLLPEQKLFRNAKMAAKSENEKSQQGTKAAEKRKSDLDKIIDVEKLTKETPESIELIWNGHYASKEGFVSGVLTADFYQKLMEKSSRFPMFVLPLPRNATTDSKDNTEITKQSVGYEFFFLQFRGGNAYFTSLAEYKLKGENSRPYLVLEHFTEFSRDKSIVLMKGEIDRLTPQEAQTLVYQMQRFYVTGGDKKLGLVEKFHLEPSKFDYNALIEETETLAQ